MRFVGLAPRVGSASRVLNVGEPSALRGGGAAAGDTAASKSKRDLTPHSEHSPGFVRRSFGNLDPSRSPSEAQGLEGVT